LHAPSLESKLWLWLEAVALIALSYGSKLSLQAMALSYGFKLWLYAMAPSYRSKLSL